MAPDNIVDNDISGVLLFHLMEQYTKNFFHEWKWWILLLLPIVAFLILEEFVDLTHLGKISEVIDFAYGVYIYVLVPLFIAVGLSISAFRHQRFFEIGGILCLLITYIGITGTILETTIFWPFVQFTMGPAYFSWPIFFAIGMIVRAKSLKKRVCIILCTLCVEILLYALTLRLIID